MVCLIRRDDRGEGSEREVDTGEGHQVGLELVQVDVEGTVEAKRSRDGGNNLSDETVQVGEAWGRDVEAFLANIVDSFVIDLDSSRK